MAWFDGNHWYEGYWWDNDWWAGQATPPNVGDGVAELIRRRRQWKKEKPAKIKQANRLPVQVLLAALED